MGVGSQKNPIIKQIHPSVYCGIRLGGMGVAIGSTIGKELAALSSKKEQH
jgi:gamma-glutamylputrescine oxidase